MNQGFNGLCMKSFFIMFSLIVTGCGPKNYEKQQYILDVQRVSPVFDVNTTNIIEVRRFTIDHAFSAKGLVYRTSRFEYESDFYNEFLISPAIMITDKVRDWVSMSGLFQRVQEPGSYVEPTHVIEGNIVALYGDYRDKSSPTAVIGIRIFLLEIKARQEQVIVFGKTYDSVVGLKSTGPEGLIAGFDECLKNIFTNLESDLSNNL